MIYIFLWFFLLIFYDDAKRGLESLTLDIVHIIILPAAGAYKLFQLCRKLRTTLTARKTRTR